MVTFSGGTGQDLSIEAMNRRDERIAELERKIAQQEEALSRSARTYRAWALCVREGRVNPS